MEPAVSRVPSDPEIVALCRLLGTYPPSRKFSPGCSGIGFPDTRVANPLAVVDLAQRFQLNNAVNDHAGLESLDS